MLSARRLIFILLTAPLAYGASINSPAPMLRHYKGSVVLINFWASWCGPCQEELPELNKLAAEYPRQKVKVVAVNVDQDRAAAKVLLKKLKISESHLEILWDSKSKTVTAYNINTMPSSFIVDIHGTIRFAHEGFHSDDPPLWRKEVNQLLQTRQ